MKRKLAVELLVPFVFFSPQAPEPVTRDAEKDATEP